MKTLHCMKATPLRVSGVAPDAEEVETLCLLFDTPLDPAPWKAGEWSLELARQDFQREAKRVVEAMLVALPGGLVDAIFGELCAYKATVFKVPHEQEAKKDENHG